MENEDKSKVAICEKCQSLVLACAAERLTKATEKEFTFFSNEGFTVKIEPKEETIKRRYSWWENCKSGKCQENEQSKIH